MKTFYNNKKLKNAILAKIKGNEFVDCYLDGKEIKECINEQEERRNKK